MQKVEHKTLKMLSATNGKFKTGKICFQDHGARVYFRNIKIRELEL